MSAPAYRRPRVICHMMASIDGRIVTKGWPITPDQPRGLTFVEAKPLGDGVVWLRYHVAHR